MRSRRSRRCAICIIASTTRSLRPRSESNFRTPSNSAPHVAVLFGDEWPQVKVKILATREEQLVPHEELLAHLARLPSLSSRSS